MSTRNGALRWTIQKASVEFGLHRETLAKYLRREGVHPGKDQKYSTQEICKGVFGDLRREQVRETRARANKLEFELAEDQKQLLRVQTVVSFLEGAFITTRERILASHLSRAEQEDILRQLVALQDTPIHVLGRKALWAEFKAGGLADHGKLSEVDTASTGNGTTDGHGSGE